MAPFVRRHRNGLSAVLLVAALAGCGNGCGPTRAQADDDVLVELRGSHDARVTLSANEQGVFAPRVRPRGGPSTSASSTTTPILSAAEWKQVFEAGAKPARIVDELAHPRVALSAIGRALAPGATVTRITTEPNRIVGRIHLPNGLAGRLRVHPAKFARALDQGGLDTASTVWVGICTPTTRGRWDRADDAYDRALGCTGWVPDRNARSVGILATAERRPPTFWPTIYLACATIGLVALCLAGIGMRRRRWHSFVALLIVAGTVVAAGFLIEISHAADDLRYVFDTTIGVSLHHTAQRLQLWSVALLLSGVVAAIWMWSDPRARRHARRTAERIS